MSSEQKSTLKVGQVLLTQVDNKLVPVSFVMAGPRVVADDVIEPPTVAIVVLDGRLATVLFDNLNPGG